MGKFDSMKALTNKQEKFAIEVVRTGNQSEAYRRAYDAGNMTSKSITEKASELAARVNIAERISELRKEAVEDIEEDLKIDARTLLSDLNNLRQAKISDYVKLDGTELVFKPFDELTENQLKCIESVRNTKYGIEMKLHGKEWTTTSIAKHIGFFAEHNFQKTAELSTAERQEVLKKIEDRRKRLEQRKIDELL